TQGVASCGKHFPGYSAATVDAHHDLPKIDRTREQLDAAELAVFRAFSDRGGSPSRHLPGRDGSPQPSSLSDSFAAAQKPHLGIAEDVPEKRPYLVDSMMICHGWYPVFESKKIPASLSHRIVTKLLRDEMRFEGLIMTDDLDMGAIINEYSLEDTIRLAIAAGNDLAMICHRVPEIENARRILAQLPREQVDRALASVAQFKETLTAPTEFSEAAFRALDDEIWNLRVAVLGPERAAERSAEDGKRSPVETY
ncbi:MAG: beta-N-acetylhexosaminidase, partial [Verrucomicrobiota bacterium]